MDNCIASRYRNVLGMGEITLPIIAGKLETGIGVISCSGNLSAISAASAYIALSNSQFGFAILLGLILMSYGTAC